MTQINTGIQFSNTAINKIAQLIVEEGNPALNFRLYITGGGCSGFQYGMTFDTTINEDDTIIEHSVEGIEGIQKLKIVIDSISYPYLKDIKIELESSPERFKIINSSVKTTCGCGSSFSI